MASFAKRTLETDSDSNESNVVEPNTSKRSCLKHSPAADQGVSGEHSPASNEPSPASGEPSPASTSSSEPSLASGEPSPATILSIEYSDKLIVDLTGDSDEDEQDDSIPPAPAVNINPHYSCSDFNSTSQLLRHLGMKRFLVDHDYILCPYCLVTDQGKRVKPSETRVSTIIQRYIDENDEGYMELVEELKEMDKIFNIDTSEFKSVHRLADKVIEQRIKLQHPSLEEFLGELKCILRDFTDKINNEHSFREVFSSFLRIFTGRMKGNLVNTVPGLQSTTVLFPNWKRSTTIRGKPDIVLVKEKEGQRKTLAVIECKKYRELKFMFDNTEIKDDSDLQKALPSVLFCKTAKKSKKSDKVGIRDGIMERMYKDLDSSICRSLKNDENTYFAKFLGQLVGEVLAWFNTSNIVPAILPFEIAQEKCMRYAIGQLGFKIIFVTVGVNNSCKENLPHIRIGEKSGMGLDVFITRPFDLMKAEDRAKIRDILFVMMRSSWKL